MGARLVGAQVRTKMGQPSWRTWVMFKCWAGFDSRFHILVNRIGVGEFGFEEGGLGPRALAPVH